MWTRGYLEVSGSGVYQQRYAASGGAKVGNETPVTTTDVYPDTTAVTALAGGGWEVTWHSGSGLYQQRYDVVGNPASG
jgi:hypothetical protein